MVPSSVPSQPGPRSRSLLPWILVGACALIALLVALVVVAGSIWYFALRETPQSVVEEYIEVWNTTDCERYEEITTESFRGDDYVCEDWQEHIAQQKEDGYAFEDTVVDSEVNGDRATVRVEETMTFESETSTSTFDFLLEKRGGDWLIDDTETIEPHDAF